MIGYKGFDKNFCCRGYQYEVGKTYHYNGKLIIGESGFHFCDTPLAVFEFYKPTESRFALVETSDNIVSNNNHKFCTDELKIIKELSLHDLIACAKNVTANTRDRSAATNTGYCSVATNTRDYSVATNTGDFSVATNTGDCSAATNTGDCSAATNTGDYSAATVTGAHSIAIVTGKGSRAKGGLGSWLVLTEWVNGVISLVKAFKVDGASILADTFYNLKDGEPVIADDD